MAPRSVTSSIEGTRRSKCTRFLVTLGSGTGSSSISRPVGTDQRPGIVGVVARLVLDPQGLGPELAALRTVDVEAEAVPRRTHLAIQAPAADFPQN